MKTIKMNNEINSANFQVLNLMQMGQLVGGEDAAEQGNPPKPPTTNDGGGTTVYVPPILIRK